MSSPSLRSRRSPSPRPFRKPLAACCGALVLGAPLTACGGASTADPDAKEITVYSADGLKSEKGDGFYDTVFKDFEKKTGIKVHYVESGSGAAVQRLARERANTKADVVVTLPPFIQQADGKGLLDTYRPKGSDQVAAADKDPSGKWTSIVNNYFCFIHHTKELKQAPATWQDLLDPKFKNKLQYSTPASPMTAPPSSSRPCTTSAARARPCPSSRSSRPTTSARPPPPASSPPRPTRANSWSPTAMSR